MNYEFSFADVLAYWPVFVAGLKLTMELAVVATVAGFCIGTLCAVGRRSNCRPLVRACGAYVELIRNTPLLVQVLIVYFGLASARIEVPAYMAGVLALVINVGAYTCEIMRAGMDSVHAGQIEAAESLAMNRFQIYWHVILRPAIEKVYPALTSQFVILMLASSITSQIGVEELTAVANHVQSETFRSFESYVVVAALYIFFAYVMRLGFWLLRQAAFPRARKLKTPA